MSTVSVKSTYLKYGHLQEPQQHSWSPHGSQVICRRCQKPRHFARECDVEQVPSQAYLTPFSAASSHDGRPQPQNHLSGNAHPPTCWATVQVGELTGSTGVFGFMSGLISSCPHVAILIGGVYVSGLLDPGSMVSTVTESFFSEFWPVDRL